MKLKLAPGKVAVKKIEAKLKGGLELPITRAKAFDLAEITCVGDLTAFGHKFEDHTTEAIEPGCIILFQVPMSVAQMTVHRIKGELNIILNFRDLVAKLDSPTVEMKGFHIIGRYVLLKPTLRQQSKVIIVPENAVEANKDSVHFSVLQVGRDAQDLDLFIGQEVYPHRGRINPMVVDSEEIAFVDRDFIDGCLVPE